MESAVLFAMAVIVGVLVLTLIRLGKSDYSLLANRMAKKTRDNFEVLKPCPLCGTMLRRGETVHSVVFSGPAHAQSVRHTAVAGEPVRRPTQPVNDHLAHLFGCPYCHPADPEHPRTCPVCRKVIPSGGYVVARMFEKPGRKHVHVLGCTECRSRRK